MKKNIDILREKIDEIDTEIVKLFVERMKTVEKIGLLKKKNNVKINQQNRESDVINRLSKLVPSEYIPALEKIYASIFETSKQHQSTTSNQIQDSACSKLHSSDLLQETSNVEKSNNSHETKKNPQKKIALIGRNINYSFSKEIHANFADYDYEIINLEPDELNDFFEKRTFGGCNVTIPYKRNVASLCSELSEQAKAIGAVNTVVQREDGSLFGDNTDYYGFLHMAKKANVDFKDKKVLIFGNGATSSTICAAVKDCGGKITVVSRKGKTTYSDLYLHKDAQILINATPVGTFPETENQIASIDQFENAEAVLDVVYTPLVSRFVQQGIEKGLKASGGLPMLIGQAKKAAELFAGKTISKEDEEKVFHKILRQKQNLILIGMPGAGKSSLGKAAAKLLNRPFIDIDLEIEQREHLSIPEIFTKYGESYFRAKESEVIAELAKTSGAVIATGGGAVMNNRNRLNLRQNGFCVLITRNHELLPLDGRPVSKEKGIKKLEKERLPVYKEFSDAEISNNGSFEDALNLLLESFK